MKVILFGATGMVGQGVLRDDPRRARGRPQACVLESADLVALGRRGAGKS
jgi:hypothetical protein